MSTSAVVFPVCVFITAEMSFFFHGDINSEILKHEGRKETFRSNSHNLFLKQTPVLRHTTKSISNYITVLLSVANRNVEKAVPMLFKCIAATRSYTKTVQYTTGKRDITGAEGRQQCSVFKHVALL
jgi:hypothetical protein